MAPEARPPDDALSARRRSADALRRLIPAVAYGDLPPGELEATAAELGALVDRLQPFALRSRHVHTGGIRSLRGDQPDLWEGHPIVGPSHALAFPLHVSEVGEAIVAEVVFGAAYEGGPGVVQGGFLITAFDYVLGRQAAMGGALVVTGTISTRFHAPVPVEEPVRIETRLDSTEGRKFLVSAKAFVDGRHCASAEGVWIAVPQERYAYRSADDGS